MYFCLTIAQKIIRSTIAEFGTSAPLAAIQCYRQAHSNFKNMKALKVSYSRLISKGNYENAKIEIELEVEEGEKASDVFEAAKAFVEKRVAVEKLSDFTIERARKVMDDKRNHTLAQIEEAEEILAKAKVDDELPF